MVSNVILLLILTLPQDSNVPPPCTALFSGKETFRIITTTTVGKAQPWDKLGQALAGRAPGSGSDGALPVLGLGGPPSAVRVSQIEAAARSAGLKSVRTFPGLAVDERASDRMLSAIVRWNCDENGNMPVIRPSVDLIDYGLSTRLATSCPAATVSLKDVTVQVEACAAAEHVEPEDVAPILAEACSTISNCAGACAPELAKWPKEGAAALAKCAEFRANAKAIPEPERVAAAHIWLLQRYRCAISSAAAWHDDLGPRAKAHCDLVASLTRVSVPTSKQAPTVK